MCPLTDDGRVMKEIVKRDGYPCLSILQQLFRDKWYSKMPLDKMELDRNITSNI